MRNRSALPKADTRLVNVVNVTQTALLLVDGARNVTLDGGGTLYGDAEHAWSAWSDLDDQMTPYGDDGSAGRTHLLLIRGSQGVTVRNLHLHNSTSWNFRMDSSRDIFVDNVDIYGDSRFPNNDGFDPESCINVTLVNSRIDVADDGICPKATAAGGPLRGFYVHNVTVRSKSHAIKFGSNTDTEMSDVVFDNITIWDSNAGLCIQQRSEGSIRNVTWSNIVVETRYEAPRWWGNGEWLWVTNVARMDGHGIGNVQDMRFVNISGRSENGGLLSGLQGPGIRGISFENVHIKIAAWSNYSQGSVPCFAGQQVCTNETVPKCVPQVVAPGEAIPCMGSRDYRPVPSGLAHLPRGANRVPSLAHALFLENAHDVSFSDVTFEFEAPRLPWFGGCLAMDGYSTDIRGAAGVRCVNGPAQAGSEIVV